MLTRMLLLLLSLSRVRLHMLSVGDCVLCLLLLSVRSQIWRLGGYSRVLALSSLSKCDIRQPFCHI